MPETSTLNCAEAFVHMNGSVKTSTEAVKNLEIVPKIPAFGLKFILKKDL